jgi:hypothetical protein
MGFHASTPALDERARTVDHSAREGAESVDWSVFQSRLGTGIGPRLKPFEMYARLGLFLERGAGHCILFAREPGLDV